MIYPHLNNISNIFWGNNYKTRQGSLIKIQKKVVRVITFLPRILNHQSRSFKNWIFNVDQLNNQQTILLHTPHKPMKEDGVCIVES